MDRCSTRARRRPLRQLLEVNLRGPGSTQAPFRLIPMKLDARGFPQMMEPAGAPATAGCTLALILSVPEHLAIPGAAVDAREMFFQTALQQRTVRNVAEMFGDEPDVLLGSHPVASIEAGQVHGP